MRALLANYGMRHQSYCMRRTRSAAVTITVTAVHLVKYMYLKIEIHISSTQMYFVFQISDVVRDRRS